MTDFRMPIDAAAVPKSGPRPIKIAITALGGQGGGVLTQWIVDLAEANGYLAQSTSVPGVAQRTGATIYYVEIFPDKASNRAPVLSLMPMPGDVDVVISAEMMEAGRAMLRGIVTPDRTTLIASTHRDYAISERSAMGNGIQASTNIMEAGDRHASQFIAFDMEKLAASTNSVISSVLFGALAGSGTLPFDRRAFEETIRATGRAVDTNLAGFAAGFDQAVGAVEALEPDNAPTPLATTTQRGKALMDRIRAEFPAQAHDTLAHGVRRMVDYQDYRYANRYLDRLLPITARDLASDKSLTIEAARYLALWMSYEDTIRVSDLKTRGSRFNRIRQEVRAEDEQLVYVSEFMSPRPQEICELMPVALGRLARKNRTMQRVLGLFFNKGRRIQTAKLSGFLMLYCLGGLRWYRPMTLKNYDEQLRITDWLARIQGALDAQHTRIAAELIECQRLVKGYSGTFERGLGNYLRIVAIYENWDISKVSPDRMAEQLRNLRIAALADEDGKAMAVELEKLAV